MSETFVKTLNNMGYMSSTLDPFAQQFVDSCSRGDRVFEGGAAFGVATLEILKKGVTIDVNDLESKHLEAILLKCSQEEQERISIHPGPIEHLHFPAHTFDRLFSSRMIHLLSGENIEKTLKNFFQWLRPGGYLTLITDTPFLKCYASNLENYHIKSQQDDKWPGLIEDTASFMTIPHNNIPPFINFLDLETLQRVVEQTGFVVEQAAYIDQSSFPKELKFDGRESAGVMAYKPSFI